MVAMSSVYNPNLSGLKAIDGIYLPSESGLREAESLANTLKELSPWIQVDLTINHFVEGVKIWDRSEGMNQGESVTVFGRLLYHDVLPTCVQMLYL